MNRETQGKRRQVALEMTDVTVRFTRPNDEPLTIMSGMNLSVPAGTIHALAGRSGSGKTTLLQVAVGAMKPDTGTVTWNGLQIDGLTYRELAAARRAHMGYIDQGATAIDELTALDNVLLPAVPLRAVSQMQDRAHELLSMFGLSARARQRARSLSGGERQRLAIARALLLEPTAIAIDEPTASLDRDSAETVIEALQQLTSAGTAVIVASHDDAVVAASDTVTRLE